MLFRSKNIVLNKEICKLNGRNANIVTKPGTISNRNEYYKPEETLCNAYNKCALVLAGRSSSKENKLSAFTDKLNSVTNSPRTSGILSKETEELLVASRERMEKVRSKLSMQVPTMQTNKTSMNTSI